MVLRNKGASFNAERVNASTFAITEDDVFGEHPIIFVKVFHTPPLLLVTDTGCDRPSKRSKHARVTRLRTFLEEFPVSENDDQPLNPGGEKGYCVVTSHCHYDHIRGAWQFNNPDDEASVKHPVVASAFGRAFVEEDLWEHSLCKSIDLPKPVYQPTLWAENGSRLICTKDGEIGIVATNDVEKGLDAGRPPSTAGSIDLGVTMLATPGHTPDSMAWYDELERHLFVGDSIYHIGEVRHFPPRFTGPIIFPREGSWIQYMDSMRALLAFVQRKNAEKDKARVRFGAGHVDITGDAEAAIEGVIDYFERIVAGRVPVLKRIEKRGEEHCFWWDLVSKFSVRAPTRLMEEYKEHKHKTWPSHLPRTVREGTFIP